MTGPNLRGTDWSRLTQPERDEFKLVSNSKPRLLLLVQVASFCVTKI